MIYCDSSFLTSLYVTTDELNPQARKEAARFTSAIPYTLLNEWELLNTLRRGLGGASLGQASHDRIVRDLDADEADGLLERASLNQIKLYEKARELSKKHTPSLACRALDILHVASALVLGAEKFASFDTIGNVNWPKPWGCPFCHAPFRSNFPCRLPCKERKERRQLSRKKGHGLLSSRLFS